MSVTINFCAMHLFVNCKRLLLSTMKKLLLKLRSHV